MSNYKCKCGNTSDFFIEHNLSQCGMYCGCCGKWIKWLNKDEERLFKHKQSNAEHDAEIINKFAEELKSRLGDAIYPKDFESMRNLIDDVARDVNAR